MVHPQVRGQLLRQLNITKQALSQRAKRIKKRFGPMTTDEAVYVIAHMQGTDLSKYPLPLATIDRIRGLVPREVTAVAIPPKAGQKKPKRPRIKVSSYPLVQEALVKAGFRIGTEIYPQLFVLENSIRKAVEKRLSTAGADWWNRVPRGVRDSVQRTITKQQQYRHREPRGDHPLYYSNFDDLKKIILANRTRFEDIIQDFEWFRVKMEETYMARNNIAHCVPLSEDDSASLLRFQREWARLLQAAGEG